MNARRVVVAALLMGLVAVAGAAAYVGVEQGRHRTSSVTTCTPLGGTGVAKGQLQSVSFGAVKEYLLPSPPRWPNGIAIAPDGSVWFGEDSVPGVGHLSPNGTLVEYPWPTAGWTTKGACGYRTGIWGVAVWNGSIWAAGQDEDDLVGINPSNGKATVVNLTGIALLPYTLAPAPDGSLWFTTFGQAARLGRLSPDGSVSVLKVDGLNKEYPSQLQFVNGTLAYFVALNNSNSAGHLYSFDPTAVGDVIEPTQVGGDFQMRVPTSLSMSGRLVWIAQHLTSSVTLFDAESGSWAVFPTSTVNFTSSTLPYFVDASASGVWFNEHYANRIAFLNSSDWTLTEFSEADPPVDNATLVQNDLTIAQGDGGLWFTSMTGNYIGFVDGAYRNSFSVSRASAPSASLAPGQSANLSLTVKGSWTSALHVTVSDSEAYDSIPRLIGVAPSLRSVPPEAGGPAAVDLTVVVSAGSGLAQGRYTVAVSVCDGLVTESVYFFLTVSQ